jgi:hypothetical protein
MTPEQKKLLEPHAGHFMAMAMHVHEALDEDLRNLLAACRAANKENCGWDAYAAAGWLMTAIQREQQKRQFLRGQSA